MVDLIEPTKLRIRRGPHVWLCETLEPKAARAQVVDLFGAAEFPTPYGVRTPAEVVAECIEARNLAAVVVISVPVGGGLR